jgi:hypothetical protein
MGDIDMAWSDWDPTNKGGKLRGGLRSIDPFSKPKVQPYKPPAQSVNTPANSGLDVNALRAALNIQAPVDQRDAQRAAMNQTIDSQAGIVRNASDQNYANRGNFRSGSAIAGQDRIDTGVMGAKTQAEGQIQNDYADAQRNFDSQGLQMALGLRGQDIGMRGQDIGVGMGNAAAQNDANKSLWENLQALLAGGVQGLGSVFGSPSDTDTGGGSARWEKNKTDAPRD